MYRQLFLAAVNLRQRGDAAPLLLDVLDLRKLDAPESERVETEIMSVERQVWFGSGTCDWQCAHSERASRGG